MSLSTPPAYSHSLQDIPGVVGANNFLSVFNPANSGKTYMLLRLDVSTYSAGTTASANSMYSKRITAASSGTLVAASTVARFRTDFADPSLEIRIGNPTVTATGLVLNLIPPVISTGSGQFSTSQNPPYNTSFVCAPGEGIVLATAAGDIDQVWNITHIWQEVNR